MFLGQGYSDMSTNADTKPGIATASRKPLLLRVASLKPCDIPDSKPDGVHYFMWYVTMTGKQTKHECSKGIYALITQQTLDYHKKSDFVLTINPQSNVVTHIVEQPKPDTMPGFKREEEQKEGSKALIIALYPDTSMSPIHVPEKVSEATIQEVMDAIGATEDSISPGVKVGNYVVLEKREVVGATEISVDPMPRTE